MLTKQRPDDLFCVFGSRISGEWDAGGRRHASTIASCTRFAPMRPDALRRDRRAGQLGGGDDGGDGNGNGNGNGNGGDGNGPGRDPNPPRSGILCQLAPAPASGSNLFLIDGSLIRNVPDAAVLGRVYIGRYEERQ